VLDTQRTLVRVGLTRGHPGAESPPTPAPEVVAWTAPTTASARAGRGRRVPITRR
jgi:hypothetical protein